MATDGAKERPIRHKTRKCPNCGRVTVAADKWSSCQWCHYEPLFRRPPEIEEREFAPWRVSWKLAILYVLVAITVCVVYTLYYSGWKLPDFVQSIAGHWNEWLLIVFITFVVLILLHFVVWYLATKIRPEFLVGALFTVGILLLVLTDKQSVYYEDVCKWIGARWDMNFFVASITVFSLGFAFAGLILIRRRDK
ncbi:MAG: hypothetical protein R6V59_06260 [Dehalococcoidia bacterium]